jgi:hypothetical protein
LTPFHCHPIAIGRQLVGTCGDGVVVNFRGYRLYADGEEFGPFAAPFIEVVQGVAIDGHWRRRKKADITKDTSATGGDDGRGALRSHARFAPADRDGRRTIGYDIDADVAIGINFDIAGRRSEGVSAGASFGALDIERADPAFDLCAGGDGAHFGTRAIGHADEIASGQFDF